MQKLKIEGCRKGFINKDEDRLWLLEVNLKVHKLVKADDSTSQIAAHHRKVLKFVKKEVTAKRHELYAQLQGEKNEERKIKLEIEAKRALAFEKMILSFALVLCLPDEIEQITDTLNQIEELMQCFKNLHLGEVASKKQ